jgi:hypothetical protein
MSSSDVQQVVVVNAPKAADFEDRMNHVLSKIPSVDIMGIDYLLDPETYGVIGIIRFRVSTSP